MDWENRLISKCIQQGGAERLIAGGIEADHFSEKESKEIWAFIIKHINKYKTSPSQEIIQDKFPEYKLELTSDSLDYIRDQFIASVKRREAVASLYDLGDIIEDADYEVVSRIDEIFLDKARDLAQIVPASRVSKFSSMRERIQSYRDRKESGVSAGLLFGVPALDELTLGVQKHEYVTIAGPTGMGKTTLALYFMMNHYLDGHTPMMISLEMDEDEIYRKLDAMAANLKQQAIKKMTLAPNDMQRWEEFAEKAEKVSNDMIVVDVDNATPEKIYAEVSRWMPDILAVDYIQLLEAPARFKQSWERIGHVSQQMKQIARQLRVPVYGLAQTNTDSYEEGAKLGNLGQSRDIGRHSDIVLGLHQDEEMEAMKKLDVRVLKNRGGPKRTISLLWDHENALYKPWRSADHAYAR